MCVDVANCGGQQRVCGSLAAKLTGEGRLVLDVDVLVLAVLLDGLFETLDALHEGRSGWSVT